MSSVSPIVSSAEILQAVANGKMTQEAALALLSSGKPSRTPRVDARRTAKGSLWVSLGIKAVKGCAGSIVVARDQLKAIVTLAKDGTLEKYLANWDSIPLSKAAQEQG